MTEEVTEGLPGSTLEGAPPEAAPDAASGAASEAGPAHIHEETRSAVEATGQALHDSDAYGRRAGHGGGHGPEHDAGHGGEHWGGNGTDPLPTYPPLGPIDWPAWAAAAVSALVAVVTAALLWLAAFGH